MYEKLAEALDALMGTFYKILKINLTKDSFSIIKNKENETQLKAIPKDNKLSEWFINFANKGFIYEADIDIYKAKTNIEYLRRFFKEKNNSNKKETFRLRYRRKSDTSYEWVTMEIIPAENYSDENQLCILFIQDINDSYIHELETQRQLEHFCNFDTLTGLNNFYSYRQACIKYSQNNITDSIGIIFSDLNGLKIVNDTYGHEAGNEYIRAFSKLLQNIFFQADNYRISGDEFISIFINIDENVFITAEKKLLDKLNEDKIPIASIGWAWEKDPEFIENVAQKAERIMYQSKHNFYKMHPEYKRGVVEESYQKEINAIIQNLSLSYTMLGTINLEDNRYKILKRDEKEKLPLASSYSDFTNLVIEQLLMEDFKCQIKKFCSIENLRESLQNSMATSCDFKLKNGKWIQTTFRKIESIDNLPYKVIFYTEEIDSTKSKKLDNDKSIRDEYQILEGLGKSYTVISLIDIKMRKMLVYKNNGLPADLMKEIDNHDYDIAMEWFTNKYVIEEDRKEFLEETKLDNIIKRLEKEERINIYFRTTKEFHGGKDITFSKFYFYRPLKGSNKIVYAAKNITNSINQYK
ncbi:MAG: GGDEF domain-containing protein [Treponema sp.]|nr:GGDEF domain-containing protein [Treponema sp.]